MECRGGEAGKRKGLKSLYLRGFAGSTPAPCTREKGLKIPRCLPPYVNVRSPLSNSKQLRCGIFVVVIHPEVNELFAEVKSEAKFYTRSV